MDNYSVLKEKKQKEKQRKEKKEKRIRKKRKKEKTKQNKIFCIPNDRFVEYFLHFRDIEPIIRHENFRLFACMNPATDVGKKDLPVGIRNR